jgi:hypothetical protein
MPPRLRRTATSFGAVFLAFCAYRLVVAPWIDPSFVLEESRVHGADAPAREIEPADYRQLFPEGAWERNDPIVLENGGIKLLMEDYQTLEGGRIGLEKCTMLFFPEGDYQPTADHQRIVILQAPKGAILQFDSELNLRRGKVGRLIGGQLKGTVEIRGTPSRPGADDDLFITTSDLRLDQRTAYTDSPVEFRYGPNRGRGRQLRIDLITGSSAASRGPNFSGIQQLELVRDVHMHLQPGAAGLLPGDRDRKPTSVVPLPNPVTGQMEYQEPPVSIRCRGPFRFDFVRRVASFEDHVDVHRPMPKGAADQMKCDLLKIYFAERKKDRPLQAQPDQPNAATQQSQFAIEPARMEATGGPVFIEAPSSGAIVNTNRIDYDLKENRVTVQSADGHPDSVVVWGRNEYRGRDLTVAQPERGRLATASAKDSGWLRAVVPDRPDQVLEARWSREMSMRPDENGQHRISLRGAAETKFSEFGDLSANEIDIWLLESPRPASAEPIAPNSVPATPVRLLAKHNVGFRSAQLSGTTERLNVVFTNDVERNDVGGPAHSNSQSPQINIQPEAVPRATIRAARPIGAISTAPPGAAKPTGLLGLAGAKSRFELQGRSIDVQLISLGQPNATATEQYALHEATVDGAVRMIEIPTASPSPAGRPATPPLVMNGERLEIRNGRVEAKARLAVTGKPAHVSARGMELVGERIQLDRGENRLWIDGAGRCVLPARAITPDRQVSRTAPRPSVPSGDLSSAPVTIDFRDGMVFDGKTARFRRDVSATSVMHRVVAGQSQPSTESRQLNTQEIVVSLKRGIDFASEQPDQQAEVERVTCIGGVSMESRTTDQRGVVSIETLHTRDLEMLQPSGDLRATGPGRLESTRLSSASPLSARLPATTNRQPQKPNQPTYTRVDFVREVTGNLKSGQIILHEDIQGIYGPVQRWGDRLPLDSHDELPEGCVTFSSDQLTVNIVPDSSGGADSLELLAIGNAEFQGQLFLAQGDRVTYVDSKKQLALEGDGRTPARMFYRQHKGGPQTEATAGKITYWIEENRADVNNASRINLGQ